MRIFGLLLLLSAVLFSCGKKWKKTTETTFSMTLVKSGNNYLSFQDGSLLINKFGLEGERKQGDDVSFEDEFDNNSVFDISTSAIIPNMEYDIPQGTYTKIRIDIRIEYEQEDNSITLNGIYDNGTQNIPVLFEFDDKVDIRMYATADGGGSEITLVSGSPKTASITLNMDDWFSTVSANMLDDADLTDVGGTPTIIINEDENDDIYDAVINRIGKYETVVF